MRTAGIVIVSLLVGGLLAALLWGEFEGNREQARKQERQERKARAERVAVKNYKAVVASCRRVNVLRREVNERGRVLKRFLVTAAEAREAAAEVQRQAGDVNEATINERAADLWRDRLAADIHDIEIADCPALFPRPSSLPDRQGSDRGKW